MNYTLFHSSLTVDTDSNEFTSPSSFSSIQLTYTSRHVLSDTGTIDTIYPVLDNSSVAVTRGDNFTDESHEKKLTIHPDWFKLLSSDFIEITPIHWLQYQPQSCSIHYLIAIVYSLIFIPGFTINLLMVTLFFRIPSLRTPSNLLNLNLAAADLLMNLQIPSVIYSSLRCKPSLGVIGCRVHAFFCGLSGTVAIVTICAMSVERYIKISQPFSSSQIQTFTNIIIVILFIWTYSLTFALIPLLFDKSISSYVPEGYLTTCSYDYLNNKLANKIYIFSFFIAAYILPLLGILYSYQSIICTVRRNRKSVIQGMLGSPKHGTGAPALVNIMADIKSTLATNFEANDKIVSDELSEPVHRSISSSDFVCQPGSEVKEITVKSVATLSSSSCKTIATAGSLADVRFKFLRQQRRRLSTSIASSSNDSSSILTASINRRRESLCSDSHSKKSRVINKRDRRRFAVSKSINTPIDQSTDSQSESYRCSKKKSIKKLASKSLLNYNDKSSSIVNSGSNESTSHTSHRSKVMSPIACSSKCLSYTTVSTSTSATTATLNTCGSASAVDTNRANLNNNISKKKLKVCPIISPTPCTSLTFIQIDNNIKICETTLPTSGSLSETNGLIESTSINNVYKNDSTVIQMQTGDNECSDKSDKNKPDEIDHGVNGHSESDKVTSSTSSDDKVPDIINESKCNQGDSRDVKNDNSLRPISSASVHRYIESTSATERKLTKCSLVLISIWTIAWTPYAIISLIGIFNGGSILVPSASIFPAILAKSASLCDPIVYSYSHPKYREIMSLYLRSIGRCICQPLIICFSFIHYVLSPILYRRPYDARKSKVSVRRRRVMKHRKSNQLSSKGQLTSGFSDNKDFSNSNRTQYSTSDDIHTKFEKSNKDHWSVLITQSKLPRENKLSLSRESTFSFTKTNSASGDTVSPRSQLKDSFNTDAIPLDVIIHTHTAVNSDKSNHLSSNGPSRSS